MSCYLSDERQQRQVNLNPNDRVPVDSGGPSGHISQVLHIITSVFHVLFLSTSNHCFQFLFLLVLFKNTNMLYLYIFTIPARHVLWFHGGFAFIELFAFIGLANVFIVITLLPYFVSSWAVWMCFQIAVNVLYAQSNFPGKPVVDDDNNSGVVGTPTLHNDVRLWLKTTKSGLKVSTECEEIILLTF